MSKRSVRKFGFRKSFEVASLASAVVFLLATGDQVMAQDEAKIAPSEVVEKSGESKAKSGGLGGGSLSFHPGLRLEAGFDSNVFFDDNQEKVNATPTLGVVTSLGLETRRSTNISLDLKAELLYLQYLSDDPNVSGQSGFSFDSSGQIVFNPKGAVALKISDTFTRTNEPPNGNGLDSYNRIYNNISAGLLIQPGGKVLTLEVGGSFAVFNHTYLPALDRQSLGLKAELKWKFLPKTAFLTQFSWDFISYETKDRGTFHSSPAVQLDEEEFPSFLEPFVGENGLKNIDSQPMRIQAGVAGLLGPRLSLVLLGGWGHGFYNSGENFSSFIGRAEGAYEIGPTSRLRLGYMRDFSDSSFSNFFSFHKVYGRYNQQFGQRFELGLEGAFEHRKFSTVDPPFLDEVSVEEVAGTDSFDSERTDPIVLAKVEGKVRFADIFFVGGRYQLDVNTSDFIMITGIVAEERDPNDITTGGTAIAQFVKHRVFLTTGVTW